MTLLLQSGFTHPTNSVLSIVPESGTDYDTALIGNNAQADLDNNRRDGG
jgi:hypothetical protein